MGAGQAKACTTNGPFVVQALACPRDTAHIDPRFPLASNPARS